MNTSRSMRQGQVVVPYGVGAIVDIGSESFVVTDISRWPRNRQRRISENSLERKLKLPIKAPNADEASPGVGIFRFPAWHFCPSCRRMSKASLPKGMDASKSTLPVCRECKISLTPMGFVGACDKGHLCDVDWFWWAHSMAEARHGQCSGQTSRLLFKTTGEGGGDWNALSVTCTSCGASRTFDGLVGSKFPGGMKCRGGQPWQFGAPPCGEPLSVYRRAASNLHEPLAISALDLQIYGNADVGPEDVAELWREDRFYVTLETLHANGNTLENSRDIYDAYIQTMADKHGLTLEVVEEGLRHALRQGKDHAATTSDTVPITEAQNELLREEWEVFARDREVTLEKLDLKPMRLPDDWPEELVRTIASVTLVRRLREVRALTGFRRLPISNQNPPVPVDLGEPKCGWYPGVEAWGEGVFIKLKPSSVGAWEKQAGPTLEKWISSMRSDASRTSNQVDVTARFLMLHSLAHVVIKRLAFDAGYAASSIRERIYSGPVGSEICGLLVYTADGDSQGSLGGLVRMGEPHRLGKVIQSALADAAWCSADPVCREGKMHDATKKSMASCHACMLASETTCNHNNTLLDRRLLVGISEVPPFFDLDAMFLDE